MNYANCLCIAALLSIPGVAQVPLLKGIPIIQDDWIDLSSPAINAVYNFEIIVNADSTESALSNVRPIMDSAFDSFGFRRASKQEIASISKLTKFSSPENGLKTLLAWNAAQSEISNLSDKIVGVYICKSSDDLASLRDQLKFYGNPKYGKLSGEMLQIWTSVTFAGDDCKGGIHKLRFYIGSSRIYGNWINAKTTLNHDEYTDWPKGFKPLWVIFYSDKPLGHKLVTALQRQTTEKP